MKFNTKATFLGQERRVKKTDGAIYYINRFTDETGEVFQAISSDFIDLPQFVLTDLLVDVRQGQYAKYNLISVKKVG